MFCLKDDEVLSKFLYTLFLSLLRRPLEILMSSEPIIRWQFWKVAIIATYFKTHCKQTKYLQSDEPETCIPKSHT